ncbi:MAG: hypothetical protein P8185_17985 [Deltaproteobacteria bacterium]|jgi:hypothetical protein
MKSTHLLKPTAMIALFLSLGAFVLHEAIQAQSRAERPANSSKAALPVKRVCEGRAARMDKAARDKSGIMTAPLKTVLHRQEFRAYGMVLALENLADLRNRHMQAKAQMENAIIRLEISQKEYDRLKKLNAENKNISDRELQAAEATYRIDAVNARTAHETLDVLKGSVQAQWGEVITGWLWSGSSDFDRLIQQLEILIQITLPRGVYMDRMPETVRIRGLNDARIPARFISASPRTDPRIQGLSYFYIASTKTEILPSGITVIVDVPVGLQVQGFFIPGSAVVWWHGSSWIYVQQDEQNFVRCEVSTENPVEEGYFVTEGFSGTERIVTQGAQLLLSEELRARIEGGD